MKAIIFDKIRSHIKNDNITLSTKFSNQSSLDSLGIMDMIMDLEDTFDVSLPLNLLGEIKTVGDLVEVVYTRTQYTQEKAVA